ncbi:tetratricopeptide repeat protein [Herpetosiphon sp. NSE202]|uniref:tetratricopeptide repeat protein n=1 Tax=Herpetosiphon sp. NSE202 TaxID=3351349 RepID=UPI003641C46F
MSTPSRLLSPLPASRKRWYHRLPLGWVVVLGFLMVVLCYPVLYFGRTAVSLIYIDQADNAMLNGKWDTARAAYVNAMDWSVEYEEPFDLRWSLALRANAVQAAVDDFSAVIKNHPDRYMAYCYRAEAYMDLDSPAEALADFQACVARDPSPTWRANAKNMIDFLQK